MDQQDSESTQLRTEVEQLKAEVAAISQTVVALYEGFQAMMGSLTTLTETCSSHSAQIEANIQGLKAACESVMRLTQIMAANEKGRAEDRGRGDLN